MLLAILDGWGHREHPDHNAPLLARTPVLDAVMRTDPPFTLLEASGEAVGLPAGQIGNSEVGHSTIGAGRILWQDLPRISRGLAEGALERSAPLAGFVARIRAAGGAAHLLGLVSPGGVHAHQDHLLALARHLSGEGLSVRIHAILDGRDVAPRSGLEAMEIFLAGLAGLADVRLATISGRYYAMDRDNRWERVALATGAILHGEAPEAEDPLRLIRESYALDVTDEFLLPHRLPGHQGLRAGDGLMAGNFRADRMRQILAALSAGAFDAFDRGPMPALAARLGLVSYSQALDAQWPAVFAPIAPGPTLGAAVAAAGLSQLRLAETEKYAHVTFFMNGGSDTPSPGETQILVPSPKVATYDLQPEMSAPEVGRRLTEAIRSGAHDLIVVNFANPDMVGHTGVLQAAILACEAVDTALGPTLEALEAAGGIGILTADHGNCEQMWDPVTGGPHTAHTTNPVPCCLVGAPPEMSLRAGGGLADLAPTLLDLLGVPIPDGMTGRSLILRRGG